jgi:hypothetical protein
MNQDKPVARGEVRSGERRQEAGTPLGEHPVGTGVGAVAGAAAAGAASGAIAGPVGAAVGAAIGAAAGGLAGKGIADIIDPTMEDEYWRKNHRERSYIDGGFTYDQDYGPAYRYGVSAFERHRGRGFDECEVDLMRGWGEARGGSRLDWDRARPAVRDSWNRVEERFQLAGRAGT